MVNHPGNRQFFGLVIRNSETNKRNEVKVSMKQI